MSISQLNELPEGRANIIRQVRGFYKAQNTIFKANIRWNATTQNVYLNIFQYNLDAP